MNKISVITVTYNCEDCVEKTIQSVVLQDYAEMEYIIVDGDSSDNTLNIVNLYKDKIALVLSEKDKGIYDAMNKGLQLASGDWVIFMNADDTFYKTTTLSEIAKSGVLDNADIVYGDVNMIYKNSGEVYRCLLGCDTTVAYREVCHQATMTRLSVMRKYCFNLQFKICADRDAFTRMHNNNERFVYIPVCFANYIASAGLSASNLLRLEREKIKIEGYEMTFFQRIGKVMKIFVKYIVFRFMSDIQYERMVYNYAKKIVYNK